MIEHDFGELFPLTGIQLRLTDSSLTEAAL
jgi:hypothetical protein